MEQFLFKDLGLSDEVIRAIEDMNFENATEIQAKAIPMLKEGKDLIGRSNTGTGKTAAFGIPAIESVDTKLKRVQVLILSPTRELAMQICEEMRKFSKYKHGVALVPVYGGESIERQIRALRNANIVVGTPGRVMDHMRRKTLKLNDLKTVILDEADEMLNMGFLEDIKTILSEAPEERQTVLFSATMPKAILDITNEFQKDPEMIVINKGQRTLDAIEQIYYQVPMGRKKDVVNIILQMEEPQRAIIFCNTKKMVDDLVIFLNEIGFKTVGLHGDMKQNVRTQVMDNYKAGRINVLIATDVAARGIDVENVEVVINYDIPQDDEYYIHRIGRTGRAGKQGKAFTLLTNRKQTFWIKAIGRETKSTVTEQPIPSVADLMKKRELKFQNKLLSYMTKYGEDASATDVDFLVEQGFDLKTIAVALSHALQSKKNKSLPAIKEIVINNKDRGNRGERNSSRGGNRVKLKVTIGRNQRIAPNFIVGAIVEDTGLPSNAIGKIDIYNDYTIIDMSKEDSLIVLENMASAKIRSKRVEFSVANESESNQSRDFRPRGRDYKPRNGGNGGDRGDRANYGNRGNGGGDRGGDRRNFRGGERSDRGDRRDFRGDRGDRRDFRGGNHHGGDRDRRRSYHKNND